MSAIKNKTHHETFNTFDVCKYSLFEIFRLKMGCLYERFECLNNKLKFSTMSKQKLKTI